MDSVRWMQALSTQVTARTKAKVVSAEELVIIGHHVSIYVLFLT